MLATAFKTFQNLIICVINSLVNPGGLIFQGSSSLLILKFPYIIIQMLIILHRR